VIAEHLAAEAGQRDVRVELVPTTGFIDAFSQLSTGVLDAALVSSGAEMADQEHLQVVAGLDVAPLHILVRRELAAQTGSLRKMIHGRRVNLGLPGAIDHSLAREILRFLDLQGATESGAGDFIEMTWSKAELVRRAEMIGTLNEPAREAAEGDLPDVVMLVASVPSLVAQSLIDTGLYVIAPFPYCDHFVMAGASDGEPSQIDRRFVEDVSIPAAMYVGDTPIPATDCPTLGMRTLLVARGDLPSSTIEGLLSAIFESGFAREVHAAMPTEFPAPLPVHAGVTAYIEQNKPFVTSQFFDLISESLSIFGAFAAGALSLFGFLRRRRIRTPGDYLEELRTIDLLARSRGPTNTEEVVLPEALAHELDERLVKLKEQLLDDCCNNRLQSELVLTSVLSVLADSRAQLRRTMATDSDHASQSSPHPRHVRVA
jgi:hypothetical protein